MIFTIETERTQVCVGEKRITEREREREGSSNERNGGE